MRDELAELVNGRPLPTADTVGSSYERDTAYERADAILGRQVTEADLTLALLSVPATQRVNARWLAARLVEEFDLTRKEPK